MAAPPAPQTHESAFGVTNIKSHIPLILDLDDHNYDAWRELFMTHCLTFDVLGHLDGTLLPAHANDAAWHKRDGLVKLWIYGTLAPPLFRSSFETGGTARDVWLRVENQFRNNKEAMAIQLDNELRTQQIGDRTIQEYCQKIKSLADLLSNVDAPVNERNLVMYLLNGLNEKFDSIINVIKHKYPFPTFAVAKSMLEMEESRLKKSQRFSATHTDHASSSTTLTVAATLPPTPRPSNQQQTVNKNRGNNNHHQQTTQPAKSNNFRGNRKNNVRYIGRNDFQFGSPNFLYWAPPNMWSGPPVSPWPNQFANWTPYSQMGTYRPLAASRPMNPNSQPLPVPYGAPWIMDSGFIAHLSATEGTLDSNLNHNINHTVIVGNGSKLPVTSIDSSISALPDDLLIHILLLVKTKDAVATMFLSKRWRFIWTMVPKLEYIDTGDECESLCSFINKSMEVHKAPVLETLRIRLGEKCPTTVDVGKWVSNAVDRFVRDLEVELLWTAESISLPKSIYTCKTLVVLNLSGKILVDIPSSVCLPSLKILRLVYVVYKTVDCLIRLLSSCSFLYNVLVNISDCGEDVFLKRNLTRFGRPHIFVLCNADDKFMSSMSLVRSLCLRLKDPMVSISISNFISFSLFLVHYIYLSPSILSL